MLTCYFFSSQLYKVSVLESIKYPELILTVKANDADKVLTEEDKINGYSDIRYLLRGENSNLFTIDNITGVIQVSHNIFLKNGSRFYIDNNI